MVPPLVPLLKSSATLATSLPAPPVPPAGPGVFLPLSHRDGRVVEHYEYDPYG